MLTKIYLTIFMGDLSFVMNTQLNTMLLTSSFKEGLSFVAGLVQVVGYIGAGTMLIGAGLAACAELLKRKRRE